MSRDVVQQRGFPKYLDLVFLRFCAGTLVVVEAVSTKALTRLVAFRFDIRGDSSVGSTTR